MRMLWTIFSLIFILFGLTVRFIANLVEVVMPKLGYAAFQAAAAGSYTPESYAVDLRSSHWLGTVCILLGIGALVITWKDSFKPLVKGA